MAERRLTHPPPHNVFPQTHTHKPCTVTIAVRVPRVNNTVGDILVLTLAKVAPFDKNSVWIPDKHLLERTGQWNWYFYCRISRRSLAWLNYGNCDYIARLKSSVWYQTHGSLVQLFCSAVYAHIPISINWPCTMLTTCWWLKPLV